MLIGLICLRDGIHIRFDLKHSHYLLEKELLLQVEAAQRATASVPYTLVLFECHFSVFYMPHRHDCYSLHSNIPLTPHLIYVRGLQQTNPFPSTGTFPHTKRCQAYRIIVSLRHYAVIKCLVTCRFPSYPNSPNNPNISPIQ